MPKVTIAELEVNYNGALIPAYACVFFNRTYFDDDGNIVLAGDASKMSGGYAKRVAVSNAGGITTIPAFSGASQLDATVDNATGVSESEATLGLYTSGGKQIAVLFSNIRIPSTPSSTSWESLSLFSQAHNQPARHDYYDTLQINRLLEGYIPSDADLTAIAGLSPSDDDILQRKAGAWVNRTLAQLKTDLSLPSNTVSELATLAASIVILSNSKQDTLVSGTNIKTVNGNSLLGSGNVVIAGGGGSAVEELLSDYADLEDAVSTIGPTPAVLAIDEDVVVAANIIIPATLQLRQVNGATISFSGVGSLRFEGRGIHGDEQALFTYPNMYPSPLHRWLWSSVDAGTDILTYNSHGLTAGEQLRYASGKLGQADGDNGHTLGGLTEGQVVYAIPLTANTFQIAETYADAIAGTEIDITSYTASSNQYFWVCPVAWTGDAPEAVYSTLIDDGSGSSSQKVQHVSNAFMRQGITILVVPEEITYNVLLADNHSIMNLPGTHENSFTHPVGLAFDPFDFPYVLGSGAEFTSLPGAKLKESSVPFRARFVCTRNGARNSHIHHNHFVGTQASFNGTDAATLIGYAIDCSIHHNFYESCFSYVCSIVNNSGNLPQNCHIHHNIITDVMSQVLFIGAGEFCTIMDNYVSLRDGTYSASGVIIDLEPNGDAGVLRDIRVERNIIDYRGVTNGGVLVAFLNGNIADTPGWERVYIKDNHFLASYDREAPTSISYGGITLMGTDGFEISGNHVHGVYALGGIVGVDQCRNGKIFNNHGFGGGGGFINIARSTGVKVKDNVFYDLENNSSAGQLKIDENIRYHIPLMSITGDTIRQYYQIYSNGGTFGNFLNHHSGTYVYINERQYEVLSVAPGTASGDDRGEATMTVDVDEPAAPLTVPAASVNTGTDTINSVGHGFRTGASLYYEQGTAPIVGTGVNNGAILFAIRVDDDNFQIATSYDNAIAGTESDITNAGTGDHEFFLCASFYSYGNEYSDNGDLDGIVLAPHSNSQDLTVRVRDTVLPAATVPDADFETIVAAIPEAKKGDNISLSPSILPTGLVLAGLPVITDDEELSMQFYNPTGAPIDLPSRLASYTLLKSAPLAPRVRWNPATINANLEVNADNNLIVTNAGGAGFPAVGFASYPTLKRPGDYFEWVVENKANTGIYGVFQISVFVGAIGINPSSNKITVDSGDAADDAVAANGDTVRFEITNDLKVVVSINGEVVYQSAVFTTSFATAPLIWFVGMGAAPQNTIYTSPVARVKV
jgi:hypothetical protein